jgi:hypothetical protein
MTARRIQNMAIGMALAAAALGSASCGDVSLGKSPSILVIDDLGGARGDDPGNFDSNLESDVSVMKDVNGQQVSTIFDDPGQVTFHMELKDQGNPGAESSPSPLNQITVDRYRVVYIRADGRNVQGVDVPYAFDGGMTVTVGSSLKQAVFTLVRIQAKVEPPLRNLVAGGISSRGAFSISTIAEVTFYGHDLAGNPVFAIGHVGVDFADWADPE